jgi:hypothetical protein
MSVTGLAAWIRFYLDEPGQAHTLFRYGRATAALQSAALLSSARVLQGRGGHRRQHCAGGKPVKLGTDERYEQSTHSVSAARLLDSQQGSRTEAGPLTIPDGSQTMTIMIMIERTSSLRCTRCI